MNEMALQASLQGTQAIDMPTANSTSIITHGTDEVEPSLSTSKGC